MEESQSHLSEDVFSKLPAWVTDEVKRRAAREKYESEWLVTRKAWSPDFALRRIRSRHVVALFVAYFQLPGDFSHSKHVSSSPPPTVLYSSTIRVVRRIASALISGFQNCGRPASRSRDLWLYNLNNHRCNFDHFAIRCLTITYLRLHTSKVHRLAIETTNISNHPDNLSEQHTPSNTVIGWSA